MVRRDRTRSSVGGRCQVAVVGAGAAGVSAAIEAGRQGASVILIDAAAEAGGTAVRAGGGICVAGTPLQRAAGIIDDPQQALEDWVRWGGTTVDVPWAERYLEASRQELYADLMRLGVRWGHLLREEGNSVPRWHAPEGGGKAMMDALEQEARRLPSISWALETRVTELLTVAGRVTGVAVEGPAGAFELTADAVLLATGGFCSSAEMVRLNGAGIRASDRILLGGGPGATGTGHQLLKKVDAEFVNLDAVWMYPFATPDPFSSTRDRGLAIRGLDGDVWVNSEGVRFHDESHRGGATGGRALLRQPKATCWSIFDAQIASRIQVSDADYRDGADVRERVRRLFERSPYIHTADDLDRLAAAIGLDGCVLRATIADENRRRMALSSVEPAFRHPHIPTLSTPPYHAVQFFPMARKNLGGVRTDLHCQVLTADGRTIPGLFAAGEVAGMAGGRINGRAALEGTMLGPSMFSGRVAGREMVG